MNGGCEGRSPSRVHSRRCPHGVKNDDWFTWTQVRRSRVRFETGAVQVICLSLRIQHYISLLGPYQAVASLSCSGRGGSFRDHDSNMRPVVWPSAMMATTNGMYYPRLMDRGDFSTYTHHSLNGLSCVPVFMIYQPSHRGPAKGSESNLGFNLEDWRAMVACVCALVLILV